MSTEQPPIQTDKQAVRSLAVMSVFVLLLLPIGLLIGAEPLTYFVMIILGFLIGIWETRRKFSSWTERRTAQAKWRAKRLANYPTKRDMLGLILGGIAVSLISFIKGPLHGVFVAILLGIPAGLALGGFVWEIMLYLRRNKALDGQQHRGEQ